MKGAQSKIAFILCIITLFWKTSSTDNLSESVDDDEDVTQKSLDNLYDLQVKGLMKKYQKLEERLKSLKHEIVKRRLIVVYGDHEEPDNNHPSVKKIGRTSVGFPFMELILPALNPGWISVRSLKEKLSDIFGKKYEEIYQWRVRNSKNISLAWIMPLNYTYRSLKTKDANFEIEFADSSGRIFPYHKVPKPEFIPHRQNILIAGGPRTTILGIF